MLKRSVIPGLVTGFLVSLALIYPVGTTLATRYIPNWENPPAVLHRAIQAGCLTAAGGFFLLGTLATLLLVRPTSQKSAAKSGGIAGLAATLMIQILVLSPAEAMIRTRDVLRIDPMSGPPSDEQMAQYIARFGGATFDVIVTPLLLGLGLGALVMVGLFSLYHLLRHQRIPDKIPPPQPPTPPNLLRRVPAPDAPQRRKGKAIRWPDPGESTWRAGILGGLAVGIFVGLQALFAITEGTEVQTPGHGLFGLINLEGAFTWLSVLTPFLLLLWGVLVLALQRTPPSRYWSRVRACLISGAVGGLAFQLTFLNQLLRTNAPLVHLFMFSGDNPAPPEALPYVPITMGLAFFGAPLVSLLAALIVGTTITLLEGLLYAWLVPLIPWLRRPVDEGRRAFRRIQQTPREVLPVIWDLLCLESGAMDAVAHLTIRAHDKKEGSIARIAAAYHTQVTHPEAAPAAVQTVGEVLAEHPNWRWRAEIGELYRLMRAALAARQVADIAIIALPPEERTSSLPKPLSHALDHLANIIRTLRKYERVDSLGGQILFLNNALDAISRAQDFVRQGMQDPTNSHATYPEKQSLEKILNQWQTLILDTIRGLRGRAELTATLETRRLPYADRLNLEMRVVNVGLNVAEDVQVKLVQNENETYQAVPDHGERTIEILLPGDGRSLEFSLTPSAGTTEGEVGALRVLFDVVYNDSVDPQQQFQVADSIDFLEQRKPFQRIFPIPYVTGTPLQSSKMFFGRADVLQFIREHLLGAYQNNVIVLHGQRRTGKTSILYQLQRVLQDSHVCVLVDMQGKAARGLVDFFYSLSDDITYALEEFDVEIELPERQDFQASPEFFFRSRFLRQVTDHLNGRNLLLMFDEFEELQARVESGKLEADIFPYLRNLMQHEPQVDFVFAGTHKLEELATEYWSILFNIATYKRISFLRQEDVTRLITEPVAPFGLTYDPLAVRRIYDVTAGQPYFVQLVCHELAAYHNETERNYLTTYDVEAVLENIIERGEAHFKFIWSGATPQERWVLLGAAEHLAHAETITFSELAAWLRQQQDATLDSDDSATSMVQLRASRPGLAPSLPDVLAALERQDILTRTSPGSRRFRFKIDLVRRWIAANPQLKETIEG